MATPKQARQRQGCLAVFVLAVLGYVAYRLLFAGPGATYRATVSDYIATNPADLAVTFHVTNTSTSSGTPHCQVNAQDPSYTYHGVNAGDLADTVAPGATVTTIMHVTITGQGAGNVTDVTVKCS